MLVMVHGRNMDSVRSGLSAIGVIFFKYSLACHDWCQRFMASFAMWNKTGPLICLSTHHFGEDGSYTCARSTSWLIRRTISVDGKKKAYLSDSRGLWKAGR